MNKMIVVSCDTETTSLDPREGSAWAVGIHAIFIETSGFKEFIRPITSEEIIIPIHPIFWNKATYQWAKEKCGKRLESMLTKVDDQEIPKGELELQMEFLHYRREAAQKLTEIIAYINQYKTSVDRIIWVFNHPDFDVPFIEQFIAIKDLIGYRNIKDMQSLIEGHMGFAAAKEFMDANKPEAGIAHTALADAIAQWELLWKSGVFSK